MMTMQLATQTQQHPPEPGFDADAGLLPQRDLEAAVLTKAADLLQAVMERWQEDPDHALLDQALRYNQALWGVFHAELLGAEHPMPEPLRANILSLSAFVDRRTFEVMAAPEAGKLEILIRINRGLAEGLQVH